MTGIILQLIQLVEVLAGKWWLCANEPLNADDDVDGGREP